MRVTFNDYDAVYDYIDADVFKHHVVLCDASVEQLLAVVKFYKLHKEASWNESVLSECLRSAMPRWKGPMSEIDVAIRKYWAERDFRARPYRDV